MATIYSILLGILSFSLCFSTAVKDAVLSSKVMEPKVGEFRRSDRQVDGIDLPLKREVRNSIIQLATAELGVREEGGENSGLRVKEYLAYVGLGKGYPWCAAFVSWCYGQAGLPSPRTAWSPALFPKRRLYKSPEIALGAVKTADLFAIYSAKLGRIHHVGLIKSFAPGMLITVEGNSNDRVESRRRALSTVYAMANWVD
jgi:hypothetical protein